MQERTYSKNAFYLIWFSDFIAAIGHGISSFALGVYVFQTTAQATAVSTVMLCAFLPSVVLAPFAGVLADRFDRRLLMVLGDGLSGLLILALYILWKAETLTLPVIYGLAALGSVFAALVQPATRATITDLVPEDRYQKASGLFQLAQGAKFLIAPFVGGLLMQRYGFGVPLLVDVLTVVITAGAVLAVRRLVGKQEKPAEQADWVADFRYGWRFIREHSGIRLLLFLISLVTFYLGFLQTLFTPLVLSIADERILGIVESTGAVGMLVSSFAIGILPDSKSHLNLTAVGLSLSGFILFLMGFSDKIPYLIATAFLFFCTLPPVNTGVEVLMRRAVPNATQGRVWGLVSFLSQIGYIVAYLVAGPLADRVFNPLLETGGAWADSVVGRIIGVGPARGIGLMFVLSGIMLFIVARIIRKAPAIRELEATA